LRADSGSESSERCKYEDAERFYNRALAIFEQALGADHPNVGIICNNLADLSVAQGKYAKAESLFKRTLAIFERKLGVDHPNVAATFHNLRALYLTQQKFDEAVVLQRRVIEIWEAKLPADHPDLAAARRSLAVLLEIEEKTDEAAKLDTQSLAVLRRQPHNGDTVEARRLTTEGNTHFENGDYILAETLYWSALSRYEQSLGPDAASVAQSWDKLSRAIAKQGREKEAAVYARRAERIRVAKK
jgi:tetratricopeptide (TPR) repeat protein